jgi:putative sterol carrier protein
MYHFNSIQEIFDLAPEYFLPENANGVQGSVQFEFTGEGGGEWFLQVSGGQLTITPGRLPTHDLYAIAGAQDSLDMANGKLNPMTAYFKGKLNVLGDTSKIFEFQKVFRLPEQFEWLKSITG